MLHIMHIRPAMCQDRPNCVYYCTAIYTAAKHQQCKSKVLAVMVRHEEDVPCGEVLGIPPPAKLFPVSASKFAPTSGNTGGEDKATAMLLVCSLGSDSGLTPSGPKGREKEVEIGACVVGPVL